MDIDPAPLRQRVASEAVNDKMVRTESSTADDGALLHQDAVASGGGGAISEGAAKANITGSTTVSGSSAEGLVDAGGDGAQEGGEGARRVDGEGEEEEPTCRVCHMEAEEARPLYHPCWCRGSIKHVHQDCLLQWFEASNNRQRKCELCGAAFTFAPVYANGAPQRLGTLQVLAGLSSRVLSYWPLGMRGALLLALWLSALPFITSNVFQLFFCTDLRAAVHILTAPRSVRGVMMEVLGGTLVMTVVVVITFVAMCAREFAVGHLAAAAAEDEGEHHQEGDEAVQMAAAMGNDAAHVRPRGRLRDAAEWVIGRVAHLLELGPLVLMGNWRVMLGLNAPLRDALVHWCQAVVYNVLFLAIFQLLPYTLGRLCISLVYPQARLSRAYDAVVAAVVEALLESGSNKKVKPEVLKAAQELVMTTGGPLLTLTERLLVLCLGYILGTIVVVMVCSTIIACRGVRDPRRAIRVARGLQRGATWVVDWCKAGALTCVDLGLVPQAMGCAVDLATVHAFGLTVRERVSGWVEWPLVSISGHWLCGFTFMVLTGVLVTELRRVLHPDVLKGVLPQPGDLGPWNDHAGGGGVWHGAEENFADLLVMAPSMREPARKLWFAVLVYLPLIVVGLYLPVRYGHAVLSLFGLPLSPLRLHFHSSSSVSLSSPYLETHLPLELFLFHIALPVLLEKFRLRDTLRFAFEQGFARLCHALGLAQLLDHETLSHLHLPRPPAHTTPTIAHSPALPPDYQQRALLLTLTSLLSLFLTCTLAIHLPIRLGRLCMHALGLPPDTHSDFYSLGIGLMATAGVLWCVKCVVKGAVRVWGDVGAAVRRWREEEAQAKAARQRALNDQSMIRGQAGGNVIGGPEPISEDTHTVDDDGARTSVGDGGAGGGRSGSGGVGSSGGGGGDDVMSGGGRGSATPPSSSVGAESSSHIDSVGGTANTCPAPTHAHPPAAHPPTPPPPTPHPHTTHLTHTCTCVSRRVKACIRYLGTLCVRACEVCVLVVLWLGIAPVLLGTLFEHIVVIPARVPLDETPFVPLHEAWTLGLVFLKIWVRCSMLGLLGPNDQWKARFERVRNNGIRRLDFRWTFMEVAWPVLYTLSELLLLPYFFATSYKLYIASHTHHSIDTLHRFEQRVGMTRGAIEHSVIVFDRHIYVSYLLVKALNVGTSVVHDLFKRLHDKIRDDQYLVGLQLRNRHHPLSTGG